MNVDVYINVSVQWLNALAGWLGSDPMVLLFALTCLLYIVRAFKPLIGR